MNVIVNLIIAVLVFLLSKWLLSLVGLQEPILTLVALVVACFAFFSDPFQRLKLGR